MDGPSFYVLYTSALMVERLLPSHKSFSICDE